MRRTVWFAPMISLALLLSACGRDSRTEWQRWQEQLRAAPAITFRAEITSETEADALTFSAEVEARGDTVTMTLTDPETLRGLRAVTSREGTRLQIEELELSLTAGRRDTLSPCAGPGILLAAVKDGHILSVGSGGDALRADFTGPGEETVTLWRGPEGDPTAAELAREGKTELKLTISDWKTGE